MMYILHWYFPRRNVPLGGDLDTQKYFEHLQHCIYIYYMRLKIHIVKVVPLKRLRVASLTLKVPKGESEYLD